MKKGLKKLLPIILISLIPTLLIWLPFLLRVKSFWTIPLPTDGMATIVANYDGPLFLVVSKTFYNLDAIKSNFQFPLPTEYYAAHFPLFPLLITLFSFVFGSPYSMLFVTLVSSVVGLYFFNRFVKRYVDKKNAMWLTFLFSILPARWLIVRSVGSSEPLFVASIIASIYYFKRRKYLKAGIWGALAQLTKSAGILLFVAFFASIVFPKFKLITSMSPKRWFENLRFNQKYPIFLIPFALILVFVFYGTRTGDFLAYFKSGDNIHLFFPPFQVFNYSAPWVGTFWLEEIVFIYLIGGLGLMKLIRKKQYEIAWFFGIFFLSLLFVSHRDVLRYALPLIPFLITAFSDTLSRKDFRIVVVILIIPIYLFSLAYISQNVMPISNWAPFL